MPTFEIACEGCEEVYETPVTATHVKVVDSINDNPCAHCGGKLKMGVSGGGGFFLSTRDHNGQLKGPSGFSSRGRVGSKEI